MSNMVCGAMALSLGKGAMAVACLISPLFVLPKE